MALIHQTGLEINTRIMQKMKKIFVILGLTICSSFLVRAQSGCTDPQATNYNSSATVNNGSCTYPVTNLSSALKVNTPGVPENSGIEWINGNIYTFGDSGNPATVFKIDTTNGNILQDINVTNFGNTDWEDITSDSTYLYIGDFGNNDGTRTDLKILKVAKSQFIGNTNSIVSVTAQAINFSYADQTSFTSNSNTNFDCESVISIGDSLYIFSKDRGDLKTRVYRMPKTPGTYTLSPYTNYNVNGKICGADYNPITNEVVLVGYMSGDKNSFVWCLNSFQGTNFFSGNKRRLELGNASTAWQTEGVAFYNETSTHRIFISNEDNSTPAGIYVADIGAYMTDIKSIKKKSDLSISYLNDNSISVFYPIGTIKKVELINLMGQVDHSTNIKHISSNEVNIKKESTENLSVGMLRVYTNNGDVYLEKILF